MDCAPITENSFSKSMRHITVFLVDLKPKPEQKTKTTRHLRAKMTQIKIW